MKNIIFLDLDGPMIPWWGIDCVDETGNKGKILSDFPFFSRMHPEAIENLRLLCDLTNSVVVTNSTHNKGNVSRPGIKHIEALFDANGILDLLATPKDIPSNTNRDLLFRTGFKNPDAADWRARKDRALGIMYWFSINRLNWDEVAFVAFDDAEVDYNLYNASRHKHAGRARIPLLHVGNFIVKSDMDEAVNILQSHPHYLPKI